MRLTQSDASFLYTESVSGPMHISSVYVLEGELAFEKVFEHFASRLHLIPSYRRKLAQVPFNIAHPEWVDDPDFDLANHVLAHRLPDGSTLEQGVDAAIELNEPILDRAHPLWKVYVISGVPDRTLILQMTHHAMIDGASGIELTTVLYDFDAKGANIEPPPKEKWVAAAAAERGGAVQPRVARQHGTVGEIVAADDVAQRRRSTGAVAPRVYGDVAVCVAALRDGAVQRRRRRPASQIALDQAAAERNPRDPSWSRRHDQRRGAHGRFGGRCALPRFDTANAWTARICASCVR